jgi:death-on-curing protein
LISLDMTEESPLVRYLDRKAIGAIHAALSAWAVQIGDEPIPPLTHAKDSDIEFLIHAPQQRFFGRDAYPTLEEKAAIIFYPINKRQIFLNGNKRMSVMCLLVFLAINDKLLNVPADELTQKALWLANTSSLEFLVIKAGLAAWIRDHLLEVSRVQNGGHGYVRDVGEVG